MKNIFITIAILTMSFVASARSIDPTPVVAIVSGLESGIREIALLGDGRLQIVHQNGPVQVEQISESALNRLSQIAAGLSFAEVKVETRFMVCKRMAPPELSNLNVGQYNRDLGSFEGFATRRVLTAQGCEQVKVIAPTEAVSLEAAQQLRESLIILALNFLK